MTVRTWTLLFVGLTFGLYLFIAWRSRVRDTQGFYVAGRGVPAAANGMATAADWMSAASFISMAGLISFMGYSGGVYLMGWTGGYVLLALLLAPYLRKFGHFTVPDFIGDRYASNAARLVAVICALFVSFTYVAGQMRGVGVVFSRFLEVDVEIGVVIGMAIVFVYATLGGMKGITWTQVAQYWVLITAFLIPAIAISIKLTGEPLPQIGLGSELAEGGIYLLDKLDQIHTDLGFKAYTDTFGGAWSQANVFFVALALMAGTAGLPHVIVRFYTVKNVKAARWSAFWALLFISFLYLTAPATAGFARYYMIDSVQGKSEAELPTWFESWSKTGLVLWLDDGDDRLHYSNRNDNEVFRYAPGKVVVDGESISLPEITAGHQEWLSTNGQSGRDWRPILRESGLSGPPRHHRARHPRDGRAGILDHRLGRSRRPGRGAVDRLGPAARDLVVGGPRSVLSHAEARRQRVPPAACRTRGHRRRGGGRGPVWHLPAGVCQSGGRVRLRARGGLILPRHRARHLLQARRYRARGGRNGGWAFVHALLHHRVCLRRHEAVDLWPVRARHQPSGHRLDRHDGKLRRHPRAHLLLPAAQPRGARSGRFRPRARVRRRRGAPRRALIATRDLPAPRQPRRPAPLAPNQQDAHVRALPLSRR